MHTESCNSSIATKNIQSNHNMSTNTSSHPVTTYIGESAWSLVRTDILACSFPHMV